MAALLIAFFRLKSILRGSIKVSVTEGYQQAEASCLSISVSFQGDSIEPALSFYTAFLNRRLCGLTISMNWWLRIFMLLRRGSLRI